MPFTLTMPKLSPTMEEGSITKWHKKVGDFVDAGELLLEIATDKATIEHTALDEGWLRKILVQEGGSATINQPIAIFTEQEKESIEGYSPPKAPSLEIASTSGQTPTVTAPPSPSFAPETPLSLKDMTEQRIKASPLAKKLAQQKGLDLSTVKGSGPGGRITSHDLAQAQPVGLFTFSKRDLPQEPSGTYEEIPLSPMRKIIARRLQESKSSIPHFYVKQTIDAQPLVHLREQLKTFHLSVTFNDMILRACALALKEHPGVNSGFNAANQTIIQFKTIDISVAVTVEAGLITPIIRHADYKNLGQISTEMRLLAEKARSMKLEEHEYKGGSFCLSNLGMFGITAFTAVINPPQSAILAVGGIQEAAVVKEGQIQPGKTLELNLSADHRVIDGALAAQFIKTLQKILENPAILVL